MRNKLLIGLSFDFVGLYCSGWVKHGPVGVIVTTMNEAFATAQTIVEDLNTGTLLLVCIIQQNSSFMYKNE